MPALPVLPALCAVTMVPVAVLTRFRLTFPVLTGLIAGFLQQAEDQGHLMYVFPKPASGLRGHRLRRPVPAFSYRLH